MKDLRRDVPLDPGLIARIGQGIAYAFTGKGPGWMTPGTPLAPVLTVADQADVKGRQNDFATGQNLNYKPGATKGLDFATLRGLADSLDVLRLIIETRKDQMESQTFTIKRRDGEDAGDRGKKIMDFLASPDRVHTWAQWQRALLEDHFVIDAPVVYPRRTLSGELYSLDLIDGATIAIMIDKDGRRPTEGPAYQQVLKGVVAANFEANELIYGMGNWRTNRIYGYSRVEQIAMTVNTALHRQLHQLQVYTEGSAPDLILSAPKEWSADQMQMAEDRWNEHLAGNDKQRRRTKFVPEGLTILNTKEGVLKDAFDEWLAMVCCYAFSVSPQPFIKMMNKATAETAQEIAKIEGLFTVQRYEKGLIDRILEVGFDAPDLEMVWINEKEVDPKVRAEIHKTYFETGILLREEIREEIGAPELSGDKTPRPDVAKTSLAGPQATQLQATLQAVASGQLPAKSASAMISAAYPSITPEAISAMLDGLETFTPEPPANPTPPPPGSSHDGLSAPDRVAGGGDPVDGTVGKPAVPVNPEAEGGGGDAPTKASGSNLTKAAKLYQNVNRPAVKAARAKLASKVKGVFRKLAVQVSDAVTEAVIAEKLAKGEPSLDELTLILQQAVAGGFDSLDATAQATLKAIFEDGSEGALDRLSGFVSEEAMGVSTDLVHGRAVEWAKVRAGELITEIEQTTMDRIKADVTAALAEGAYTEDLAGKLMESYGFSDARAEMIARTELAAADSAGNMATYRDSGVVPKKAWLTADGDRGCVVCSGNEAQGEIGIDDEFSSGDDAPPAHPNCLCVVVPIVETQPEA